MRSVLPVAGLFLDVPVVPLPLEGAGLSLGTLEDAVLKVRVRVAADGHFVALCDRVGRRAEFRRGA